MAHTGTSLPPVHESAVPQPRDRRRLAVVLVASVVALAVLATGLWLALRGPAEDPRLTWAPPELEDPTTVQITEEDHGLDLDPEKDYVVEMPDEPLDVPGGVIIVGGRNVVLIGGEIRISEPGDRYQEIRGLYLINQTGTVHVEGLHISGDELGEGINLDQREGATVQLQNIRVDTVHGERDGHHADVIQTWAGPSELRIDKLTGSTTYQGFFLLPQQFIEDDPERFDLRRVNLHGEGDAAYLLWRDGADWPLDVQDVWVSPAEGDDRAEDEDAAALTWSEDDEDDTWDDVQVGVPPGGDFVPAESVGVDYVSPGYREGDAA